MKHTKYSFLLLIALLFSSCSEDPVEPSEITYSEHVEPIMSNYCITCHGAQAPSAGLSLTSYDDVRNAAEFGTMIARLNSTDNPMPPTGNLSQELIDRVEEWSKTGYKE